MSIRRILEVLERPRCGASWRNINHWLKIVTLSWMALGLIGLGLTIEESTHGN